MILVFFQVQVPARNQVDKHNHGQANQDAPQEKERPANLQC